MPNPSDRIGDDRLREILAGCEGVTPGPWMTIDGANSHVFDIRVVGRKRACVAFSDGDDSRHIAHLDPQTVSSIVSELLSHRERLAYRHDELVEAVSRPTKEPSNGK
jgi:hypothetical protein